MAFWGAINSAVPVAWMNWLAAEVRDAPEAGGGLMVAAIQLAIMSGAALGGALLDHFAIAATFVGGASLLVLASVILLAARSRKAEWRMPPVQQPVASS
jgi:predicted MFS family arabinose efflux permease